MHVAPPNAFPTSDPRNRPPSSRLGLVALVLGLLALVVFPALMLVGVFVLSRQDGFTALMVFAACGALSAVAAFICAIVALVTLSPGDTKGKLLAVFAMVSAVLAAVTGGIVGGFGLLMSSEGLHGRPLRRRGAPVLPEAGPSDGEPSWRMETAESGWAASAEGMSAKLRATVADGWLEDARTEHASVAAFSRLSLDLLAISAPPALVLRAHEAAIDEVHHARIGYAIASAYAKQNLEPLGYGAAALVDHREVDLVSVARESLLEGVVGEGACADLLRRGSKRVLSVVLARHMARLAADERRHAELAKDIVRFCVTKAGPALIVSLVEAVSTASRSALPEPEGEAQSADLAPHGRFTKSEWSGAYAKARTDALAFLADLAKVQPKAAGRTSESVRGTETIVM
jgi:hypothetical protein